MLVRIDIRPIDSFDRRSFVLTLVLLGNPNKYVYINGIKNVISHAICYHAICSIMLYVIFYYVTVFIYCFVWMLHFGIE